MGYIGNDLCCVAQLSLGANFSAVAYAGINLTNFARIVAIAACSTLLVSCSLEKQVVRPKESSDLANAERKAFPSGEVLFQCVKPILKADKYASAWQTSNNSCRDQQTRWADACVRLNTPIDGDSSIADRACEFELRSILRDLGSAVERERPKPKAMPSPVAQATADWFAGRSLPGLPSLKAHVYVGKNTLICPSVNALGNPNVDVLLLTRTCALTSNRIRVAVLVPTDAKTYIDSHVFGAIIVELRSEEGSNATVRHGWVRTSSLQN